MDHRVGAFAPVEVVLQALGHGEDIFGAARLNDVLFLAVGADDGDGEVVVAGYTMDGSCPF
jgi:hypothetical protein